MIGISLELSPKNTTPKGMSIWNNNIYVTDEESMLVYVKDIENDKWNDNTIEMPKNNTFNTRGIYVSDNNIYIVDYLDGIYTGHISCHPQFVTGNGINDVIHNGTGDYTLKFDNSITHENYGVITTVKPSGMSDIVIPQIMSQSVTDFRICMKHVSGDCVDVDSFTVVVYE